MRERIPAVRKYLLIVAPPVGHSTRPPLPESELRRSVPACCSAVRSRTATQVESPSVAALEGESHESRWQVPQLSVLGKTAGVRLHWTRQMLSRQAEFSVLRQEQSPQAA